MSGSSGGIGTLTESVLYFSTSAAGGTYPAALWVTDGTAAGTHIVQSYVTTTAVASLGVLLDVPLFGAIDADGTTAYVTLGTPQSNKLAFSTPVVLPPDLGLIRAQYAEAVANGNSFYIGGATYGTGARIVEVNAGGAESLDSLSAQSFLAPEVVTDFTGVNADVYFVDENARGVARLYVSDGSAPGTVPVLSAAGLGALTEETSGSAGTRLFFAETNASGATLEALAPGSTTPTAIDDFGAGETIESIANAGNALFIDTEFAGANTLSESDGTNAAPTELGTLPGTVQQPTPAGDGSQRLFFTVGTTLYVAAPGTLTALGTFASIGGLFADGSELYFAADDGVHGTELWASDGTVQGTTLVDDLVPGSGGSNPSSFGVLNGTLYFTAYDAAGDAQLYATNGTAAGTTLIDTVLPGSDSPSIGYLAASYALIPQTSGALVTFRSSYEQGITDGTFAGTNVGYGVQAGVLTYTVSANYGSVSLEISHGSPQTTLTLPIAATNSYPYPSASSVHLANGGAFFSYSTTSSTDFTTDTTLDYIANTSLTPVSVGTFDAATSGTALIVDQLTAGSLDYVLVEQFSGGSLADTQLWSSDGSAAGTQEVADLGAVDDPGRTAEPPTSDAVAGSFGWAALLANSGGTISLFHSAGHGSGAQQASLAALGLGGTIDNAGDLSLAAANGRYFFSVANAGTVEAVATDGTAAGTVVLTSNTASGAAPFGDFTASGTLVYFDEGSAGALWVSDGTAAGTRQLLASGALLAPTAAGYGVDPSLSVPNTASVTVGATTWFYFAATENGSTGLYRTDGTIVQTVLASGVATAPNIVVSGGLVFFLAGDGSGSNTIWKTDPAGTTASQVVDASLYPADSLLATYYPAPTDVSALTAAVAVPGTADAFFLTPNADTVIGGSGDTSIYASSGDVSTGDTINGGSGFNDLYLDGAGSFDLALPAALANITVVEYTDDGQTITLRPGTSLLINEDSANYTGPGATIIGAANSDTIDATTYDSVLLGSNTETIYDAGTVTADAADLGGSLDTIRDLDIIGGGAISLGTNETAISTIDLAAPTTLTTDGQFGGFYYTVIQGSTGTDVITLTPDGGYYFVEPDGGGDTIDIMQPTTVDFEPTGTTAIMTVYGTGAQLNGSTIDGFNFSPLPSAYNYDEIDISDFAYSAAEAISFVNGTLTVDKNGTGQDVTTLYLPGATSGGGFAASADSGSGSLLQYYAQLNTLTTGVDTVEASGLNLIVAPDDTLNPGDVINGHAGTAGNKSILQLTGAGSFDLAAPATLENIDTILGDQTGGGIGSTTGLDQTITLRNGFNANITLGPGHDTVYGALDGSTIDSAIENFGSLGDTIFIGDAREKVFLEGTNLDVIHASGGAALAGPSDALEDSFSSTGTYEIDGGGTVGVGSFSVRTVAFSAPTTAFLLGENDLGVIQGSTGTDTIYMSDYSSEYNPEGGGDTVVAPFAGSLLLTGTGAQLNGTTIDAFNFIPAAIDVFDYTYPDQIDITDLAYSAAVTPTFGNGTLTVSNGAGTNVVFYLPAAPAAGSFTAVADSSGNGTLLNFVPVGSPGTIAGTLAPGATGFTGSQGNDALTVEPGALAAGQTIDGEGGNNELVLSGTGDFDLSAPAVLANFEEVTEAYTLTPGPQTITLRAGLVMTYAVSADTLIGAASADPIVLDGSGNTVIVNNPSATVIDGIGGNTISVDIATLPVTIYGGSAGTDHLAVSGSGPAIMGGNIEDVAEVDLQQSGIQFAANDLPGLSMVIGTVPTTSNTNPAAGPPDVVWAGSGGDTLADLSVGNNILIGGTGQDTFQLGTLVDNNYFSPQPTSDTLFDFAPGDTIALPELGFYQDVVNYNSTTGQLVVENDLAINGYTGELPNTATIDLGGSYDGTFSAEALASGFGSAVIFAGTYTPPGVIPCYAAGTRIATPDGERAVETLQPGEPVLLAGGGERRVRWIGQRRVDCGRHPQPERVWPIRISAGAFADNLPRRDLLVSPDHAIFCEGRRIPAGTLVNGTTVVQLRLPAIRYVHVELDRHDLLLAEGLPAESYLDTGNRAQFANSGAPLVLHPDFAARDPVRSCAPLCTAGPALSRARLRLIARAFRLGVPGRTKLSCSAPPGGAAAASAG
ncbi:MAG: Hint domain-containing protein [Acidisphaera sp.]|nr:Hint domain-containing protein [Acidisphaera sp.]